MPVEGICKLCENKRLLAKQSHIIPEFMYKDLYNEKGFMRLFHLKDNFQRSKKKEIGVFEKWILCFECENSYFGGLEGYASNFLYENVRKYDFSSSIIEQTDWLTTFRYSNVEYAKLKLFLLSMLWRALISKNPFFKLVQDEEVEKTLHSLLKNETIGDDADFRISIFVLKGNDGKNLRLTARPQVNKIGEGSMAVFFIGGLLYFIETRRNSNFIAFDKYPLRPNGSIDIPAISGKAAFDVLKNLNFPEHVAANYTL